jgi:hypothetical protein
MNYSWLFLVGRVSRCLIRIWRRLRRGVRCRSSVLWRELGEALRSCQRGSVRAAAAVPGTAYLRQGDRGTRIHSTASRRGIFCRTVNKKQNGHELIINNIYIYIHTHALSPKGRRGISDSPLRRPRFTKTTQL